MGLGYPGLNGIKKYSALRPGRQVSTGDRRGASMHRGPWLPGASGALPVHGQPTPRAGHWLTPALGRQPGEYGVKHPAAWAEHLVIL